MTDTPCLRRGIPEDEDWLFQLFRNALQEYIDRAWGWDELLQREGFITSLPARSFQVLESGAHPVGSYHLSEKPTHLELDMILVEPTRRGQGLGRIMMDAVQATSREKHKAVELSVLKINPALAFHEACGFQAVSEEEHSIRMRWPAT